MNLKTAEPHGAISSDTTPHGALGTSPFAGLFLREAFNGGASLDDAIELNRIMISSLYLSMIFSENRPTFPDHALVVLSQKVAVRFDKNQLWGEIHASMRGLNGSSTSRRQ